MKFVNYRKIHFFKNRLLNRFQYTCNRSKRSWECQNKKLHSTKYPLITFNHYGNKNIPNIQEQKPLTLFQALPLFSNFPTEFHLSNHFTIIEAYWILLSYLETFRNTFQFCTISHHLSKTLSPPISSFEILNTPTSALCYIYFSNSLPHIM